MTTGIFSALSFVSYFIPPEIVPGRMGMLITLFLILINSYNSVDAPPDRGTIHDMFLQIPNSYFLTYFSNVRSEKPPGTS